MNTTGTVLKLLETGCSAAMKNSAYWLQISEPALAARHGFDDSFLRRMAYLASDWGRRKQLDNAVMGGHDRLGRSVCLAGGPSLLARPINTRPIYTRKIWRKHHLGATA